MAAVCERMRECFSMSGGRSEQITESTQRVHGVAVILNLCGCAGAPMNSPVCRKMREGFSLSGGRMKQRAISKGRDNYLAYLQAHK